MFALLLPITVISTMYGKNLFSANPGTIMIPISTKVRFRKEGRQVQVGEVAWFVGNVPNVDKSSALVVHYFQRIPQSRDNYITTNDEQDVEDDDNELMLG
jgi:hypothetical protein